jgi:hypothetical protein
MYFREDGAQKSGRAREEAPDRACGYQPESGHCRNAQRGQVNVLQRPHQEPGPR